MRILVSAYACEPGKGSEPGVGWNWVCQIARFHEVWVITRANNRSAIEEAIAQWPMANVHWIFFDLPRWVSFWKRGRRGIHLYYYLWQLGAYLCARRLHKQHRLDLVHHVTLVTFWMPSFMALLPLPFLWGPVGGGDSTPVAFCRNFNWRGKVYEAVRSAAQRLSALDPFVRLTARRAALALGTTEETCRKILALGCREVQLCSQVALARKEIEQLSSIPLHEDRPFRVASVGALLHLKGFDLALRAFAGFCKNSPETEYWIIGDGMERARLQPLAAELGIADQVIFWGRMCRQQVLTKIAECDVILHPALHDSGGWVPLEAMAAGRPVICLDLAGPGAQVTSKVGFKVPAQAPDQAITAMASALTTVANDTGLRRRLAAEARDHVRMNFNWDSRGSQLRELYANLATGTTSP